MFQIWRAAKISFLRCVETGAAAILFCPVALDFVAFMMLEPRWNMFKFTNIFRSPLEPFVHILTVIHKDIIDLG